MEYTIGEVIDRLSITNLKMWHLEEQMNNPSISLEDIVKLNNLRNKCIDSINEYFEGQQK
jgi:hypothetical protein